MAVAAKPPKNEGKAADAHRERMARRSRESFDAVADIGVIPPVADPARREACRFDLLRYIETYRPNVANGPRRPFGPKQREAIARTQRCVLDGGRFLNGLPRGYVKSTISEDTVVWAASYGHRSFGVLFGATKDDADQAIDSVKREFEENDLVAEDFPEIAVAVQALEGKPQRCHSQTHLGRLTHIQWTADTIVLPTILVPRGWGRPGAVLDPNDLVPSEASGAIIRTKGLLGASRGMRFKRPDGRQARPDLVVIDDGQTDESAISPTQVAKRLNVVRKSILRLGGHGRAVAAIWNGTVIAEGDAVDQLADPKRHPEWQAIRVAMMPTLPDALESFWLGPYAETRRSYDRDDPDDQKRAHRDATKLYVKRRAEADAGAEVSWEEIPLEDGEISAIQHAMNILVDDGEEVFASECQNQPKRPQSTGVRIVRDAAEIETKTSGFKRGELPEWTSHVVLMIDAHKNVHYWTVAAVDMDFRGTFVDYGVFPGQPTRRYSQARAKVTLADVYAKEKLSAEELVVRSLLDLTGELIGRTWRTVNGNVLPVSLGLIDTGYLPDAVGTAILRSPHAAILMGSRGVGFGPLDKPMPEYDTSSEKVRRAGPDRSRPRWYVPKNLVGGVQVVRFDAGYWKETLHARLAVPDGGQGEWTLYGGGRDDHGQFAEHLASQEPVARTEKGRTVDVWKLRSGHEDHHLDTSVGCLVAASVLGCRLSTDRPAVVAPSRPLPPLGFSYADED